jgi:TolA-binding protein
MTVARLFRQFCLNALALCFVLPMQAQPRSPSPDAAYRRALQLYQQQSYHAAARAFGRFAQSHPDGDLRPSALYYQADARLRSGQEASARPLLRTFLDKHPRHPMAPQAALSLGRALREAGRTEEGAAYLEEYLPQLSPRERGEVLLQLGRSALKNDRTDDALDYLERAAQHEKTAPAALRLAAQTLLQREQYAEAARRLERLERATDGTADTGLQRAEAYYRIGRFNEALAATRDAANLTGDERERLLLVRAESARQLGKTSAALDAYDQLLALHPATSPARRALFGRALLFQRQERFAEAADAFAQVRKRADSDSLALRSLFWEAQSRTRLDQTDAAIKLYGNLIDRWPDADLARRSTYELGVLLYRQERWREAHRTFSRYLDRYPGGPMRGEVARLRGQIDAEQGALSRALRNFEDVEDASNLPDSTRRLLRLQRAWLLFQQGRYDQAVSSFTDVKERYEGTEAGSEALFWAAESRFRQDQYSRAVDLYRRLLEDYPRSERTAAAQYGLGWALFKRERYEEAASAFGSFLRTYEDRDERIPYRTDARLRLGDSHYARKQFQDALGAYSRVSGQGRDYALFQLGTTHYRLGNYDKALAFYDRLAGDVPASRWRAEAQSTRGYSLLQQQNYDEAIAAYRELLSGGAPQTVAARAQYGIGDALFNAGRLDESIEAYEAVLRQYPNSPQVSEAASGIQYALIALGEADRADAIIQEFSNESPRLVDELRFRRGEVLYQSGQSERALNAFQRFVRTSEREELLPAAYYYLGQLYADQDQFTEAESYLQRLTNNFPESERRVDATRRLAQVYLEQEKYEQALQAFERLEKLQSEDVAARAEARYGRSRALVALGRSDKAVQLLERSAEELPENKKTAPVRLGLARLYEERGDVQDARQLYQQIVESNRGDTGAEALFRWGALLHGEGEHREALSTLSRMTSLFPSAGEWQARGLLVQARAAEALDRTGEATRFYEQVLDRYSGTPWAETARNEKEAL